MHSHHISERDRESGGRGARKERSSWFFPHSSFQFFIRNQKLSTLPSENRKREKCRRTHAWVCRPFSQPSLRLLIYCDSYFFFPEPLSLPLLKARKGKKNWGKKNRTQFLQLFCLQKDPIFFHSSGANQLNLIERTVCQATHLRFC